MYALIATLIGVVGCSKDEPKNAESDPVTTTASTTTAPEKTEKPATEPDKVTPPVETPKADPAAKPEPAKANDPIAGLSPQDKAARDSIKIVVTKEGTGPGAANGDTVFMQYAGTRVDGFEFDSNDKGGKPPYPVTLPGQVIRGWQLGLLGMKAGEERTLTIPSELGYGAQGQGNDIPPNSVLIFKVKVCDIVRAGDETTYDFLKKTAGTGPKIKKGDKVKFNLEISLSNKVVVQAKKPMEAAIGDGSLSIGLDDAFTAMNKGGKYEIRFPTALVAAGEAAALGQQVQGQVLTYRIEVLP